MDDVDILRALAHEVRLGLMRTLMKGELAVAEIRERTGVEQPALSQQLAILRHAGLVRTRREAQLVFYRLAPDTLRRVARLAGALADAASPGRARAKRKKTKRR